MSEQETVKEKALSSPDLSSYDDTTVFNEEILKNADLIVGGRYINVFCVDMPNLGKVAANVLYGIEDIKSLIESMKHAHHANIVPFLGVLLNDEHVPIGYVLEHMENGDVYRALNVRDEPIAEDIRHSWIHQAARGLEFLHGKNIIHRFINTAIMLLCNSYKTLRLGGLGWSCDHEPFDILKLENHHFLFDPRREYNLAPEVISHQQYTEKSDIYSLGCCIVEILRRKDIQKCLKDDDCSEIEFVVRTFSAAPESRPTITEIATFFEAKEPRKQIAGELSFLVPFGNLGKNQREREADNWIRTYSAQFHKSAYSLKSKRKFQPEDEDRKELSSLDLSSYDDVTVFSEEILENADLTVAGRFGAVFSADTPKFGKVAANVFHDTEDVQWLIDILRHSHHANIVPFLGILLTEEHVPIGYVLEHMENGDVLRAQLQSDLSFTDDLKCSWIHQAARGLEFLHGKDIIHRSVSTAMMLLCNSYKTLRLGGLGWCCHHEILKVGKYSPKVGMAPEVDSHLKYSMKSDVYNLGQSIFEILRNNNEQDALLISVPSMRDFAVRIIHILPECRPTMTEIAMFFEEKEQYFVKRKSKRIVFDWKESDANIFTMDMLKNAEKVGSGMYGNVFRTKTEDFGDVAVKIFKNCITVQEQREIINMMKHSNHPNIVRFLGIVASDESSVETPLGYAMEFMPEKTVSDALHNDDSKIPSELRYSWICQASKALLYLHGRGILHRDVKPLNMLLCDSRKVLKMCDMGMSKNFINGESLSVGMGVGTLEYIAPEVLSASKKKDGYSCSADVYSLAISVWEILSRRKPYKELTEDMSVFIFLGGVINATIRPSLGEIEDVDAKMLLERAWNSNPEVRPEVKDIEEFFDDKRKTPLGMEMQSLSLL